MVSVTPYEGILSALPTPMTSHGEVDLEGLLSLMAWQKSPTPLRAPWNLPLDFDKIELSVDRAARGVDGFVLYGTTGEAPTLSLKEKLRITEAAVEAFKETPLIAGIGTNSTKSSAELAREVRSWGIDGGLLVTPYYNRPSQEGIYRHVLEVAEAVPDWPLVLYIVPGRAAVTLEVETIDRLLSRCPQIVSIKDASADLSYCAELVNCCDDRATVLSGDDPTALAAWAIGAQGSISVGSNLFPAEMAHLWELHREQRLTEARRAFLSLHPMICSLFIESNPVPLKYALAEMSRRGLFSFDHSLEESVRGPLAELSQPHRQRLTEVINRFNPELFWGQR